MRYFEDLVEGTTYEHTGSYVVTEEEILEVGNRWDPQPFHTDPVAAEQSVFGGLVASSVHMFAILVALGAGSEQKIAAVSALGFDAIRVHAPTRPGDEITCSGEVIEARPSSSRPGIGVARVRNDLFNQRGERVFSLESAFLVQYRDPAT